MEINIVLWIVGGLMAIINMLLALGYKNMKEQIKENSDKSEKAIDKVNILEIDIANTKTNYVSRFNDVNNTINKVEKSILAEIRNLSETIISVTAK